MKLITKTLTIILITIIIINTMATTAFAAFSIRDVFDYARGFPGSGSEISEADLKELQSTVFNMLTWFGVIAAVIGSVVLGIQFIMSTPEGKAEVKEKAIPFLIGCVVVFSALTIWKVAVNIAQGMMPG